MSSIIKVIFTDEEPKAPKDAREIDSEEEKTEAGALKFDDSIPVGEDEGPSMRFDPKKPDPRVA